MKLAFSSNAFKKYSLENAIREIAKIGFKGVEILGDIPHAYPPEFSEEQIRKILLHLHPSKNPQTILVQR